MEPLTEHRQVDGPVVYGFLRLVGVPTARKAALTASLAEHCRVHELQLFGVFTDHDATSGAPTSAAFAGLLDVLDLPDVYGVLTPAASHLGPKPMAADRRRRIEAAGARLFLVRHTRPALLCGSSRRLGPDSVRVSGAGS
ncbi:hypothetical protein [Streptomyces sp. SGAir0957]